MRIKKMQCKEYVDFFLSYKNTIKLLQVYQMNETWKYTVAHSLSLVTHLFPYVG